MLFLGDQALHVLSLIAAVVLIDRAPMVTNPAAGTGLWTVAFEASYLRLLVLTSGWIVATTGAGYFFALLFILVGEPAAIGFLAAAKSVFRIGELKESKDRKLAEYILIGTLLSFAAVMVVGLVTTAALRAVR